MKQIALSLVALIVLAAVAVAQKNGKPDTAVSKTAWQSLKKTYPDIVWKAGKLLTRANEQTILTPLS